MERFKKVFVKRFKTPDIPGVPGCLGFFCEETGKIYLSADADRGVLEHEYVHYLQWVAGDNVECKSLELSLPEDGELWEQIKSQYHPQDWEVEYEAYWVEKYQKLQEVIAGKRNFNI